MNIAGIKQQFVQGRYFPIVSLSLIYLAVSSVTRLVLFFHSVPELESPASTLLWVMPVGVLYDAVACLYLFAFYALYLFLLPQRLYRAAAHRWLILLASFGAVFGLLYLAPVEYFFFDEFDARFNFVAVDYLLHPKEVFINIWESYPVARVLAAVCVLSVLLYRRLHRPLHASLHSTTRLRERALPFAAYATLLALAVAGVDVTTGRYSENRVANELAQNGIYSFFYALFHNELDYNHNYVTLQRDEAAARLRRLVHQPNATFLPDATNPIARHVSNPGESKHLHVVLLVQESLGAEFVGAYGDQRGLTPNIDRLAKDSLVFTNVYATGTRTVRGLEAISSSFPPIPGEAIVKRRRNEGIFNWGEVMRKNGYTPTFVYGGYGTFDNMNYFFGNNGFRVVDRTDVEDPKFGNIWGVSDEDLFHHAIKVFDEQHARGEKIFSLIMSTSNHKPFTYPEGIPGIQARGGGRDMGVKYADYAIGKFFEEVSKKPYFADTLFVIVGDHGARVYGREDIPMRTYELPLLVYAPGHIKPRRVDTLASQIDIAPTVLGLLHISYDSVFFGRDIFVGDPKDRYVLLSHNRDVAMYRDGRLVELSIHRASHSYQYDKKSNRQTVVAQDDEQVKNAASIFQEGYDLFRHRLYRLN